MDRQSIKQEISKLVASEMGVSIDQVDSQQSFHDLGLDSISSMFMLNELEQKYDLTLKPKDLLEHSTVETYSAFIFGEIGKK